MRKLMLAAGLLLAGVVQVASGIEPPAPADEVKPPPPEASPPTPDDDETLPPLPPETAPAGPPPQRFSPTEKVRADFPVSFPIDI